jgi:hypothetical protein
MRYTFHYTVRNKEEKRSHVGVGSCQCIPAGDGTVLGRGASICVPGGTVHVGRGQERVHISPQDAARSACRPSLKQSFGVKKYGYRSIDHAFPRHRLSFLIAAMVVDIAQQLLDRLASEDISDTLQFASSLGVEHQLVVGAMKSLQAMDRVCFCFCFFLLVSRAVFCPIHSTLN